LFGVTQRVPGAARFACGSMVRFDQMFVIFALVERKTTNKEQGSTAVVSSRWRNNKR
jgi:hypothetical protein